MTVDIHKARELAHEFSVVLTRDLTAEQIAEVNARNDAEINDAICHSHDFCDANESMIKAFQSALLRPMAFDSDGDTALVNEAWAIAKNDCLHGEGG